MPSACAISRRGHHRSPPPCHPTLGSARAEPAGAPHGLRECLQAHGDARHSPARAGPLTAVWKSAAPGLCKEDSGWSDERARGREVSEMRVQWMEEEEAAAKRTAKRVGAGGKWWAGWLWLEEAPRWRVLLGSDERAAADEPAKAPVKGRRRRRVGPARGARAPACRACAMHMHVAEWVTRVRGGVGVHTWTRPARCDAACSARAAGAWRHSKHSPARLLSRGSLGIFSTRRFIRDLHPVKFYPSRARRTVRRADPTVDPSPLNLCQPPQARPAHTSGRHRQRGLHAAVDHNGSAGTHGSRGL